MSIPLSIDTLISSSVTVSYSTSDGGATAGTNGDYLSTTGSLTFQPSGPTTLYLTIPINADGIVESNETFSVNLNVSAGSAELHTTNETATSLDVTVVILNDEGLTFSIDDAEVVEGDSGSSPLPFTIQLSESVPNDLALDVMLIPATDADFPPSSR